MQRTITLQILTFLLLLASFGYADPNIDILRSKLQRILVGKVITVSGYATSAYEKLRRGAPVYLHDEIKTDTNSRVLIRFTDGTLIAIRPLSHFIVKEYLYSHEQKNTFDAELLKGGFRSMTGEINKHKEKTNTIVTPVTTLGIRGTLYTLYLPPESNEKDLLMGVTLGKVCLFDEVMSKEVCLGDGEQYRYASKELGKQIKFLKKEPENLNDPICLQLIEDQKKEKPGTRKKSKTLNLKNGDYNFKYLVPEKTRGFSPSPYFVMYYDVKVMPGTSFTVDVKKKQGKVSGNLVIQDDFNFTYTAKNLEGVIKGTEVIFKPFDGEITSTNFKGTFTGRIRGEFLGDKSEHLELNFHLRGTHDSISYPVTRAIKNTEAITIRTGSANVSLPINVGGVATFTYDEREAKK